nr:glycosyltransferase family A protein [Brachybacterium sillae]
MPQLSVIIPCFDSGEGLKDQLSMLVDQNDAPSREILLCDNGGNPWLNEYVDSMAELPEGVDIRVVDAQTRPGAAYARNRGIAEARAAKLAFCDDDDLVHPDWCRLASRLLDEYEVVSGGWWCERMQSSKACRLRKNSNYSSRRPVMFLRAQ